MHSNGNVYCPMNSSPINSSSNTAKRTKANSGKLIWNSKLSLNNGLYPSIEIYCKRCLNSVNKDQSVYCPTKFMLAQLQQDSSKDLSTSALKTLVDFFTFHIIAAI